MDKNKEAAMNQAIERLKGREVPEGTMIGCRENPQIHKFLRYDGDVAICCIKDGGEVSFPRAEIFDVRKVINVANHFLNLGFWNEGMESIILHVGEKP